MHKLPYGLRVLLFPVHFCTLGWVQYAALALSAASTSYGIFGSGKAEKKAKDNAKQDQALQAAAAELQVESIIASKDEAQASAAQKMSDMARQAAIERGRILAGAGEAGIAGASVSSELLVSYFHEADARGRELYNLSAYKRQANRDITAANLGATLNKSTYQNTGPSAEAQILSGAVDALSIYSAMRK